MSTKEDDDKTVKKTLVAKRGGHKGYATKIMKEARTQISSDKPNKARLSAYMKGLQERKDLISKLDNEIIVMCDDEEMGDEIMSSGDFHMELQESLMR